MKFMTFAILFLLVGNTFAASYRVKINKPTETSSGFYYGTIVKSDDASLSGTVRIYPSSKDAYETLERTSKGALLQIKGTSETVYGTETYDKINAIIVYNIFSRPVQPRPRDRR